MLIKDRYFSPFIGKETIQERVRSIAKSISEEHADSKPVFLVILNGAFMFAADLLKNVNIPCEVSFVKLKSYDGLDSSGTVKKLIGLENSLKGREIIVVEDIVDSGKTLQQLLPQISDLNPASVSIATLLFKPDAIEYEVDLDFIGFEIPNAFVVGYGLDYDGFGRNLQDIYQLSE